MNKKQPVLFHNLCILLISAVTGVSKLQSMVPSSNSNAYIWPLSLEAHKKKQDAQNELMPAIFANDLTQVEQVMKRGADPDTLDLLTNLTPLDLALITNTDPKIIKALLEKNADPNRRVSLHFNKNRITPLMLAAQRNSAEVLRTLVLAGADTNAEDNNKNTVLYYVKDQEICEELKRSIHDHKEATKEKQQKRALQRVKRILSGIKRDVNEGIEAIKEFEDNEHKKIESSKSIESSMLKNTTKPPLIYFRGMNWRN